MSDWSLRVNNQHFIICQVIKMIYYMIDFGLIIFSIG